MIHGKKDARQGRREGKSKWRFFRKAIENHETAAWADAETSSEISDISHPSLFQALNAKEYVDENEK